MESSEGTGAARPPSNHHHNPHPPVYSQYNYNHIHFSPQCLVHNSLPQPHYHHHPSCPHIQTNLQPPATDLTHPLMTQANDEAVVEEEDEEEDPIFVLTDEWRDFFAKSDAKRKAAKKEAKKKGKQ